jgi:putative restriction endonuclease
VHRPRVAGISGHGREGADSVVLAGGYEDVDDFGNEILYTGHGGANTLLGLPVRVIRGARLHSPYAPPAGYRYDGLYSVDEYWRERGRSGFRIWRFRLVKLSVAFTAEQRGREKQRNDSMTTGKGGAILRPARETEQTRRIKALYHYRCQMCGVRLETPAGPYAEAVHIRPPQAPHNGPSTPDNLLCLCPNHRVLFVLGAVGIDDDFTLLGQDGRLHVDFRHAVDKQHLRYHREHHWVDPDAD